MSTLDWVFLIGFAGVIWALFSQREVVSNLRSSVWNLSRQVEEVEKNNEALEKKTEEMEEFSLSLRDPVERPLALAGFDSQEIYILKLRLGEMNIPLAPVYSSFEKEHPELSNKYQCYLEEGGIPVEALWNKYSQE